MSYILDALKKADAERSLGEIPDIHAQAFQSMPASFGARRMSASRWILLAGLIVLLAIAAWYWTGRPATPNAARVVPPLAAAATEPPPPVTTPTAPINATTEITPPTSAAPTVVAAVAKESNQPQKIEKKSTHKPAVSKKPTQTVDASPTPKEKTQPTAVEATQAPVPTLRQLPLALQREIPAVEIGGYIYSQTVADRSVLINQHLLREGEQIAAGLTLEKIRADGVVLDYRGHRFRQSY